MARVDERPDRVAGGRREVAGPILLVSFAPAVDISLQVRKSHFP